MQSNFFVLEGIDATGKSTVAKSLAQRGVRVVESPIRPFMGKQAVIERATPFANFLFFMASNAQLASLVRENTSTDAIVCVRYVWSSIAYHVALGGLTREEVSSFWKAFAHKFQIPGLAIFLSASDPERQRRFALKSEPVFQSGLQNNEVFQRRLKGEYSFARKLVSWPSLDIDTTSEPPEVIVDQVLGLIGNRG